MTIEGATKEALSFLRRSAGIPDAKITGVESIGEVYLVDFESPLLHRSGFVIASCPDGHPMGFRWYPTPIK